MTPKWIKISAAAFLLIVACGAGYIGFGAWRDLRKPKVAAPTIGDSRVSASGVTEVLTNKHWIPCELRDGIYHCGGSSTAQGDTSSTYETTAEISLHKSLVRRRPRNEWARGVGDSGSFAGDASFTWGPESITPITSQAVTRAGLSVGCLSITGLTADYRAEDSEVLISTTEKDCTFKRIVIDGEQVWPATTLKIPTDVKPGQIGVSDGTTLRWVDPPKIEDSYVRDGNTWRLTDRTGDLTRVVPPHAGQVACPKVGDCLFFDGTGWKKLARGSEQ